MARRTRASSAARFALIATALLLPTLSMIPLGGLYLWEHGLLFPWALAAAVCVTVVHFAQRWLFSSSAPIPPITEDAPLHPAWTPLEEKAWGDVRKIASSVDVDKLDDTPALMELAHRTINAVANRIHADKEDALWHFTMPEALAITERVSGRLNAFVIENIPFGEKLTVSQVLQIYRWRSVADVAERAYNLWRLVRLANPATALTHEARERLSRAMMQWGREHVARRLAETFVEEVGRAAIDLYGGRLKIAPSDFYSDALHATQREGTAADINLELIEVAVVAEDENDRAAISVLLADMELQRTAAVAAFLRGESTASKYLRHPRMTIHLIRNAAANATPIASDVTAARNAALIIFVTPGPGRPTAYEHATLSALAANATVIPPILLPLVSPRTANIDSSMSDDAWSYPGKALAPIEIGLAEAASTSNQEAIWNALKDAADDIRRIHLLRRIDRTKAGPGWRSAGWQAARAAGRLTKNLLTRRS